MQRSGHRSWAIAAAVAVLVLGGCTSSATSTSHGTPTRRAGASSTPVPRSTPTTTGTSRRRLGAAGCRPASPIATGPEIQGTGKGATLYGLIMTTSPAPIKTAEQVKIVWRMTGSGPLHLTAFSPQGTAVPLQWGPEAHSGSNFDRPGREWGAGYLFNRAGCWRLHAQRTAGSADVWIDVQRR
jgi:hypothetical protein